MDHNEAVRLQAAEKYLLGELPKEQHAAYEEHYFDCHACAEELKATVAFLESARKSRLHFIGHGSHKGDASICIQQIVHLKTSRFGVFG